MRWINEFQLFLFDFDGLLVNTEEIHFMAYQRMCAGRGFHLNWDFDRYCQAAHYDVKILEAQLYAEFPKLKAIEPDWKVLYAEKRKAMLELMHEGAVHMMPGAESLLRALQQANIKRCVVTHSPDDLVAIARRKNPILDTIPFWITREDYSHPKPNPECYIKALEKYASGNDRVVGFEDTPRGVAALLGVNVTPVMVCQAHYPEIPAFKAQGVIHYPALDMIPEDSLSLSKL